MNSVAIIIVTYNNRLQIVDCLRSVRAQKYDGNFNIVVVDNNSADNTVAIVQKEFPEVHLLKNKNTGYAGGNNRGIAWSIAQGIEYIVFLNPDMEVEVDWLAQLVSFANTHEDAALIQAKVLFYTEKYRVNSVGNPLHFAGFSWSGGFKELSSRYLETKIIPMVSGSSFLIRTNVLQKIGWFDEKLFMYHEDVDLSWRARLAGFEIYLAPLAKAFHKYTFSFGTKKFYYAERNRLVVLWSNYRVLTLLLLTPFLLVTEIAMLLYAFFTGWFKYKLLSWLGFIIMIPHIIKSRWRVGRMRQISDKQMMKYMSSDLDFEALKSPFITYLYNPFARVYFFILKALIHW